MPYVNLPKDELRARNRAAGAAYRARNKERLAAELKQWRAENPELYAAQKARQRIACKKARAKRVATPEGRAEENRKHREYMRSPTAKLKRKDQVLRKTYNITLEERNRMIAAQGGVCAIFGCTFENEKKTHVDHDHETGQIRGVTCHDCNLGLGHFHHSISRLKAAIAYLERALAAAAENASAKLEPAE